MFYLFIYFTVALSCIPDEDKVFLFDSPIIISIQLNTDIHMESALFGRIDSSHTELNCCHLNVIVCILVLLSFTLATIWSECGCIRIPAALRSKQKSCDVQTAKRRHYHNNKKPLRKM